MAVITPRQYSEFEMVTVLCAEKIPGYNEPYSATNEPVGGNGFEVYSLFEMAAEYLRLVSKKIQLSRGTTFVSLLFNVRNCETGEFSKSKLP